MDREATREQCMPYWEKVREAEKNIFPEFAKEDIYAPENTLDLYFAPSWHFKRGLITEDDVKNLLSDNTKKILSVGSGAAFLERFLHTLGIKKENMTLSDIDTKNLPDDFKVKIFDMWSEWSCLEDEQYDLIIFPESVMINIGFETDEEKQDGLYYLISQALSHLSATGIIRMNIHLEDAWGIRELEERFQIEGQKIKITLSKQLMEVKKV